MATTRIMALHIGKGRTESQAISDIIDYVANPQKTDNGRLITGYECDSRTADAEFLLAKRQYIAATGRVRGADDVIAYHVRQSFLDLGFLDDYSAMKDMLTVEVVGKDQNAEMLQSVPHQEMEDLAAVYRIDLGETENGNATFLITNEMLRNYGITPDQLHQDALDAAQHTMKYSIRNMTSTVTLWMKSGTTLMSLRHI